MNDAVRKHSIQPGWDRWKTEMLKNANKAKPFEPELAKPKKKSKPTTESDNSELDDAEMALLLQNSVLDDIDVSEDEEPIMLVKKQRPKKP